MSTLFVKQTCARFMVLASMKQKYNCKTNLCISRMEIFFLKLHNGTTISFIIIIYLFHTHNGKTFTYINTVI